jgi:hypothetical protein
MFDYERLSRCPSAFRSLTGLNPTEFEALLIDFQAAHDRHRRQRTTTTRQPRPRRRAAGAGHPFRHDARHRLLMALVWLRVYPTYELLGFFFGLHKRNAQLNVRAVLAVLDTLGDFPFDRPAADRQPLTSAADVMTAFPEVRLVIDGKEQRVHKPQESFAAQKPYYSGKKKAHTLKSQIAVRPNGLIESVSASVPGSVHDLTLLRDTDLLGRLLPGEGVMVDKGYVGLAKDYAAVPIVIPFKAAKSRPLTEEQQAFNRSVAQQRIVVEHTMAQLNRYTVLRQVFRGRWQQHPIAHSQMVRVVARLVNRRMRVCPLKTYAMPA